MHVGIIREYKTILSDADNNGVVDAYKSVAEGEKDIRQNVYDNHSGIAFGNWKNGYLDMGDVKALDKVGEGGASGAGAIIHETIEQFEKAKMGLKNGDEGRVVKNMKGNKIRLDYLKAHTIANTIEDLVNGNKKLPGGELKDRSFLESDGTVTRQLINVQENGVPLRPIEVDKIKLD